MAGGLLGKKLGMTQIYDEAGVCVPVTVLQLGPCPIIQKKTQERDGYAAVQIGYEEIAERKVNKPELGLFKKQKLKPLRFLREFRIQDEGLFEAGQILSVALLRTGDSIDVIGTSKGKGFQGVIKRHGLHGGPAAHGSRFHRTTGSIGQRTSPGEVAKGQKLPGHMGACRVTTRGLQIVAVRPEDNIVLARGAVPGAAGGLVFVRLAKDNFEKRFQEAQPANQGEAKE